MYQHTHTHHHHSDIIRVIKNNHILFNHKTPYWLSNIWSQSRGVLMPTHKTNSIFFIPISHSSFLPMTHAAGCRQPEGRLGLVGLTCPQAGRLQGLPVWDCKLFVQSLHLHGCQLSRGRTWHRREKVLLMFTDLVRRTWWTGRQQCLAWSSITKSSMLQIDAPYTVSCEH